MKQQYSAVQVGLRKSHGLFEIFGIDEFTWRIGKPFYKILGIFADNDGKGTRLPQNAPALLV